jgi:hypothetical protein
MSLIWYGLAKSLAYPSGEEAEGGNFLIQMIFYDASTKRPQPVFVLSIKSSLNDFIPDKW